ncbi:hypothetical protein EJ05DRAFT_507305 [Pseudovirgaria hyperparasitica]|uniref:L domain-like protein n=1 Tax=Pseudovirgaria hyperparasitica TaxID=470096 RepID=A0A6A6WFR0_9PEZI|nr:uncharacterized protein EJ05DRAFT_507305 [Pseudovirgaria hyperparasitica]KAF2761662.1 hypothetical protein EJ05DRAFT_507305 [Pseudovirgaria hyperparasitica]
MASNAWLDDLSEDWIPQPRSSSSTAPSSPLPNSTTHNAVDLPTQNRSRIPRLRTSSGALIAKKTSTPSSKCPTGAIRRKSALAERSLSEDNIQLEPSSDLTDTNADQNRQASRSYSAASISSVLRNGTVEQKSVTRPLGRSGKLQDTPEWRRRLLKGEMGYGDQKDLFSPMGIEKIFDPTKSAEKALPVTRRRPDYFNSSAIPSSPPPWPSRPSKPQRPTAVQLAQSNEECEHESSGHILEGEIEKEDFTHDVHEAIGEQSLSELMQKVGRKELPSLLDSGISSTASGDIELRNEEFSPVYLSKNNTIDDRLQHGGFENANSQLTDSLGQLQSDRIEFEATHSDAARYQESMEGSSLAKIQNMTLPEDLPVGTPEVAKALGNFVTTRRGGYSADGSFARRPLSSTPPLSNTNSRMEESRQLTTALAQTPRPSSGKTSVQKSVPPRAPSPPSTVCSPRRDSQRDDPSANQSRTSGSPLKLFGDHDTFTANRLHRRLSQLELGADSRGPQQSLHASLPKLGVPSRLTSVEEMSFSREDATSPDMSTKAARSHFESRLTSFGTGVLEGYEFPGEISIMSESYQDDLDDSHSSSPSATVAPPGSQPQFRFRLDGSFTHGSNAQGKRIISQGSSRVDTTSMKQLRQLRSPKLRSCVLEQVEHLVGHKEDNRNTDGKRPPTSPAKNPTPKRRRTLHNAELPEVSDAVTEGVLEKSAVIQSVIGKRKDARRGLENNVADPNILAKRHILRPRNPTPSQKRRDEIQAEVLEATEAFLQSSPTQLQAICEDIDASELQGSGSDQITAVAVANEVASFTLNVQAANDNCRKRSVTTQDFLDEAMQIMEFIRTKGRPMSGLGSLEESESEHAGDDGTELKMPGSPLTFSRPASRNGPQGAWRNPQAHVYDQHTLSHLRRYKEGSSEFMPASIQSFQNQGNNSNTTQENTLENIQQGNIRIREPLKSQGAHESGVLTQNSQSFQNTVPSYDSSAGGRSVATTTSKRSEMVATLAPQAVAHLIPEEVAGMTYDRERGVWVKKRTHATERPSEVSIESEEDPFKNIPDLTVDEIREIQNVSGSRPDDLRFLSGVSGKDFIHSSTEDASQEESRVQTIRAVHVALSASSSTVNSKPVFFSSSTDPIETRATSWSEQEMINQARKQAGALPMDPTYNVRTEDFEHEIRIDEGRNESPRRMNGQRLRDVTITFTSPVVSQIPTNSYLAPESERRNRFGLSQHYKQASAQTLTRKSFNHIQRQCEPMPAEDGYSEVSFLADRSDPRRTLFSLNVSNTLARRQHALMPPPSSPSRADVTFLLSDLPEFSLNQVDERELPDRMIVQRGGKAVVEDRFAQGTAELVKALQDVEPEEPFWEDLRAVNLAGKGLPNLHRLDAFCWSLEDVDVSDNAINHLNGVPRTVRRFCIRNNCLSGLSSWGHLTNLQCLDVSGNDIDNLKGLSSLFHLRELIVDDNRIENLDGILNLDGLIKLSARRNRITSVDLESSNLKCLAELDLSVNQIQHVRGLESVPRLRHLNLDDNKLVTLPCDIEDARPCTVLKSLSICRNQLKSLIVEGIFPHLKCLYADGNRLSRVEGVERLQYLQSFSLRSQRPHTICAPSSTSPTASINLLSPPPDLSALALSANIIPVLDMPSPFLMLQRLELSSCGLNALPSTFSKTVPNVRYLNVNTNGLKDLSPLLNTKALAELHVAGNRLSRLRKTMAVLARLSHLRTLDLRNNPITVGFYPTSIETHLVTTKSMALDQPVNMEPFVLPNADAESEASHRLRLDEDTRLRRRVYDMLLGNSCTKLAVLDGLRFDAGAALAKDEVFERLRLLGVLKRSMKAEDDSSD